MAQSNNSPFIILGVVYRMNKHHQQKGSYVTSAADEACAAKDDEEEDPPPTPPSDARAKASSSWGIILEFTFASIHRIRTVRPECHRKSAHLSSVPNKNTVDTKPQPCRTKSNGVTGILE